MAGWEIYLDLNENGGRDPGEPNTITSANPMGFYEFPDMEPDSYIVSEVQRPDWTQTFPLGDGNYSLTLDPNDIIECNFGNYFGIFDYGGGTGEPDDPYLIYMPHHLNQIGENPDDWGKHFKLMADISLHEYTGTEFHRIGTENQAQFYGNFDGNGHIISNFHYSTSDSISNVGIFGYCTGDITDLHIVNPIIDVPNCSYVGGIIGWLDYGSLTNCSVRGGTIQGDNLIGGLVGALGHQGAVIRSFSNTLVSGNNHIGGATGYGDQGFIVDCYSHGEVNGNSYVGGLVGYLNQFAYILRSYSMGLVTGSTATGGLVGLKSGQVSRSFFDITTSGQNSNGAGIGLTTDLMQDSNTFLSAGWDLVNEKDNGIENYWWMCEDELEYPRLAWEFYKNGDYACPEGLNLYDYAHFSNRWLDENCQAVNNCAGTDLNQSGIVDAVDLYLWLQYWLANP